MAGEGINWQVVNIPFAAGLNQKADDRARPQPFLDIAKDVQFDELGGCQTRLPFGASAGSIFGGGTLADCRRVDTVNGELVVFTKDAIYAWNEQLAKWVLRSTYLAVDVAETPRFATTGDQIDGDRAELLGTVVDVWVEGTQPYVAAHDKVTGAVLLQPTAVNLGVAGGRPRLVALVTKILFFFETAGGLEVIALDPANPAAAVGGLSTNVAAAAVFNSNYDVCKVEGQDLVVGAYRRDTTTSYSVFTCTSALVVTTSTKARTCTGPIAVASVPVTGLQTQVIRQDGAVSIQGDFLTTSTLADVTINQTIVNSTATRQQIAACYRSVQNSGAYRCYVYASSESPTSGLGLVTQNFVDTAGTIGTSSTFIRILGVASRAFDYNGSVYAWFAFAQQSTVATLGAFTTPPLALQNTYFLYRDDGLLVAKVIAARGGGFPPTQGHLNGVALTSGTTTFSWCGTQRRRIKLGTGDTDFAAREPVDVVFTFDSDKARRCDRIGSTLYISGGEILQYDGVRLVEVGFHIYPWILGLIDAPGGATPAGVLSYKQTYRYLNAQGETERSTTATIGTINNTGARVTILTSTPLTVTHKTTVVPAAEFWRTVVVPSVESPFFLVSSQDPAALTNPNRYMPNSTTVTTLPSFNDDLADASITIREANNENGAVLEAIAPPAAAIIVATDTRLFLAGVAGDPDRVWYSRLRANNEVASFNDTLVIDVPRPGGALTSIAFLDETLFVFRATSIYALPGQGLDNVGQGSSFGPARIVSLDLGAISHEAVALIPQGLIFKSSKGWQLLRGNGSLEFIGDKVSDYDSETPLSIVVVEKQHQVRILSSARMLVWDYLVNQWFEWSITDGVHSCMYRGQHVYLTATGTRTQLTTYTGLTYGLDVETTWIKLSDLQGAARCRKLQPLGEVRSSCLVRARVGYNYRPGYVDDVARTPTLLTPGDPLQVKHGPRRPQCEALKLRITAVTAGTSASLVTTSLSPVVATLGGTNVWTATFQAVPDGDAGNNVTLDVAFTQTFTAGFAITVLDHFAWSHTQARWVPSPNTIGVHIQCQSGVGEPNAPLVSEIEAAILAGTTLATMTLADPFDFAISSQDMNGSSAIGDFTSGAYGAPAGEAIKLTSLGLEVGIETGLFRRIASPSADEGT